MNNIVTIQDMQAMSVAMAASRLFGVKTKEEAFALMCVAQAEGLHPAAAVRDYHVINGRPALKADAMLARFQTSGGTIKWIKLQDDVCEAEFTHPQGGTVKIDWDIKRAKAAELGGNGMWKKYPRQMLRARVISEGVRTVFPGCVAGFYTPEEVQDFDQPKEMGPAEQVPSEDEEKKAALRTWYKQNKALVQKAPTLDDLKKLVGGAEFQANFAALAEISADVYDEFAALIDTRANEMTAVPDAT